MKTSVVSYASPHSVGLRFIEIDECIFFESWELAERPYPWTSNQFLETTKSDRVKTLVWQEGNLLVGYAVIQIVDEEAHLLNFTVRRKIRRHGFGFKFLQKIMDWAQLSGAQEIWLDVDPANKPARSLYEKCEFKLVEIRQKAYPRGEDLIAMVRDLK